MYRKRHDKQCVENNSLSQKRLEIILALSELLTGIYTDDKTNTYHLDKRQVLSKWKRKGQLRQ